MKRVLAIAAALALLTFVCGAFVCCRSESGETVTVLSWNLFLAGGDTEACLLTLESSGADVICLQEANDKVYERIIEPFVDSNPRYNVACSEVDGKTCRTPIIYNGGKLSLSDFSTEIFTDSYQGSPSKSVSVCAFVTTSGTKFVAATMHGAVTRNKYEGMENLTAEQLAELATKWRIGNARQAVAAIDKMQANFAYVSTFLCGDFNFTADSEPFAVLQNAGYRDAQSNALAGGKDGYKTVHLVGEQSDVGEAIDHVVGNDKVAFVSYKVLRDQTTLLASDHCPLLVEVQIFN